MGASPNTPEGPHFRPIDLARVLSSMAASARAQGLAMPGVKSRSGEDNFQRFGDGRCVVTIPRERDLDGMKRAMALGILAANRVSSATDAFGTHMHNLLASVEHVQPPGADQ